MSNLGSKLVVGVFLSGLVFLGGVDTYNEMLIVRERLIENPKKIKPFVGHVIGARFCCPCFNNIFELHVKHIEREQFAIFDYQLGDRQSIQRLTLPFQIGDPVEIPRYSNGTYEYPIKLNKPAKSE